MGIGFEVRIDLQFQCQESYGHDLYTCKRSRSKVNQFERQGGNGPTEASATRSVTNRTASVHELLWISPGVISDLSGIRPSYPA